MFGYEPEKNPGNWPEQSTDTGRNKETRTVSTQALATGIFTPGEAMKLITTRGRYLRGEMTEWTAEHKRLLFTRWLYEHGRITG